jgi:hypothetical protein
MCGQAAADVLEQRPQAEEVGHEDDAAERLAVGAGVIGGDRRALHIEGDVVDGRLLRPLFEDVSHGPDYT